MGYLNALARLLRGPARAAARPQPRIAIVGAGFAGLGAAIRLQQAGFHDFTIYEQAASLGGTWRDNTYPGAACDVPSDLYSFSFAPNPDWRFEFGTQPEILAYLHRCADRYGLRAALRCETPLRAARYDAAAQVWRLRLGGPPAAADAETESGGETEVDVLILAAGPLSRPALPALDGLGDFAGKVFHSACWDHDYPLDGKRVAVIGTGASAVQFVPRIAPQVATLTLFQRTPPWVLPQRNRPRGAFRRALFRRLPGAQRLARLMVYWRFEARGLGFVWYPPLMRMQAKFARSYLARHVGDAALRAQLTPRYTMGCKRVLLSSDYYRALNRDNVTVVGAPIARVERDAVVCADGTRHPVDAIICATGFLGPDQPPPFSVIGADGADLFERWRREGPQAYLGTTVAGFPNFFMLVGPNTGLGHTSLIQMIESQLNYVISALRLLRRRGARAIEVRADVQRSFNERVQHALRGTVWDGSCRSWYLTRDGRNAAIWPGFTFGFRFRARTARPADHRLSGTSP